MRSRSWTRVVFAFVLFLLATGMAVRAQVDESLFDAFKWRSVGPAGAGGRVVDIAVAGEFPYHVFVATATGGLWTTANNGVTWTPIFDHESTSSVGAVAVHPDNPDVIWVGTGEANARNSVSWGHGVFKSTDGGKSWTNVGLEETHHIGRIVVDPRDPNTVWVAALGHVWGPNPERGLYKTSDGGRTWEKSLSINDRTGVVDVAMDPRDSNTLYAAAYQVQRDAFAGGSPAVETGPDSGIYKTTDGGRSWKKLSKGLPKSDLGRIGLSVSRSNPNYVYAIVQTESTVGRGGRNFGSPAPERRRTAEDGGVFRSEDRGESWTWVNSADPRPFYYSQIRVDPQDPMRVYILGNIAMSEDGGENFENLQINVHVDHHALWIDPNDSNHLVLGNDGGIYFSFDRGKSWDFNNQMAIGQFYSIDVDMRKPYYIYGGVQDYCSWGGPSATRNEVGITNGDWHKIMTGDGFQARIDPTDYTTIYAEMQGGGLIRHDLKSGLNTAIKPESADPDNAYRFNWETPIIISPHDHNTLFMGANLVLKSTNRGNDWQEISGDLTEATEPVEADESQDSDEPAKVRKIGSLTTLSESPIQAGLIYAGTDDGLVHVTRDGGGNWANLTDRFTGLPGRRWVSRIVASKFEECRAYVSFDGHRNDDYAPYLFKTDDCGENWTDLTSNLPRHGSVRVIREDTVRPDLLFLGTEFALFTSLDGGSHWTRFMSGLPTVPIADLVVHPRDGELVAGTHGRSAWVVDIAPLREINDQLLARDFHLFDTKPVEAFQYRVYSGDQFLAEKRFIAENPEYGAAISYYLKEDFKPAPKEGTRGSSTARRGRRGGQGPGGGDSAGQLEIAILDAQGNQIRKLEGPAAQGLHRIYWDLRSEGPQSASTGRRGGRGGNRGPLVEPGNYTIRVQGPGGETTGMVQVQADPEVQVSQTDRRFRRQTLDQLIPLVSLGAATQTGLQEITNQLNELKGQLEGMADQSDLLEEVKELSKQIDEKTEALNPSSRSLSGVYGDVRDSPFRPTGTQTAALERNGPKVKEIATWLNGFIDKEMNDLERKLRRSDVPRLKEVEPVKIP